MRQPALEIVMQSWVGRVIAERYALERILGAGGCGAVFRARHLVTQKHLALKVIPCMEIDPATARRFELEASIPARVDHPSMVAVYDAGYDPAGPCLYVAQELLIGKDLRTELELRGSIPWQETIALLVPAMKAISAAHEAGLLQRDIKPENIFLAYEHGSVATKVLDWGIALATERDTRVTTEGAILGTPWYLAPEIISSSRNASPMSDVWAMACVLFECITGNSPFDGDTTADVIAAVLTAPVLRVDSLMLDVPASIADVIVRGLERDPSKRFQSMPEMLDSLLRAARAESAPRMDAVTRIEIPEDGPTSIITRETTDPVTTQVRRRQPSLTDKRSMVFWSVSLAATIATLSMAIRPQHDVSEHAPVVREAASIPPSSLPSKIAAPTPPPVAVLPDVHEPATHPSTVAVRHAATRRPRGPADAGVPHVETTPPRNGAPVFEP